MESKEEIKLMSEKYATTHEDVSDRLGKYLVSDCFQDGYTQCQEEIADKKYTEEDLKLAFETGRNFQLTGEDNFNELLNSLNKQH